MSVYPEAYWHWKSSQVSDSKSFPIQAVFIGLKSKLLSKQFTLNDQFKILDAENPEILFGFEFQLFKDTSCSGS